MKETMTKKNSLAADYKDLVNSSSVQNKEYKKIKDIISRYYNAVGRSKNYKISSAGTRNAKVDLRYAGSTTKIH